jgi:hypothetical protein
VVARELIYREPGAFMDQHRLCTNLLSSMPATFNCFAPLKLDLNLAGEVLRDLFPWALDEVTSVHFEHSPGRKNPAYTADHTAFDVLFRGFTEDRRRSFIAIEVKYSETMWEPVPAISPRVMEIARTNGLYRNPEHPALRLNPIQQLFREHALASSMIGQGGYDDGLFVVIAPALNAGVHAAAQTYRAQLNAPELLSPGFHSITLEAFIDALARAGAEPHAQQLRERYCAFDRLAEHLEPTLFSAFATRRPAAPSARTPLNSGTEKAA